MRTAVDLINLSSSAPLNGDVSEKVWTGKEVSYKHLKVFGCWSSVQILKDERSKLDDKAKHCIFVGYAHEEFGYSLWGPIEKKIIRSRDVIFLEDQTIEDFDKSKKFKVSNEVFFDPISPPAVNGDGGGDEYDIPTDAVDNQVPTTDEEQEDHVK